MTDVLNADLAEAIGKYPNLAVKNTIHGVPILKGVLDILDDTSIVVGSFLIEIHPTKDYPYRFPQLYEIGGDILNQADWHKYTDGRCCITVPPDEIIQCKNGITILQFIESYAIPYFANQIYRKTYGSYKNGEYAHGTDGMFQFYENLFKSKNTSMWLDCYNYTFTGKKILCGRNEPCLCDSGFKFKTCHLPIFDKLRVIGKEDVLLHFTLMKI